MIPTSKKANALQPLEVFSLQIRNFSEIHLVASASIISDVNNDFERANLSRFIHVASLQCDISRCEWHDRAHLEILTP